MNAKQNREKKKPEYSNEKSIELPPAINTSTLKNKKEIQVKKKSSFNVYVCE